MIESGAATVEVREGVHDGYSARIDAAHDRLVWTHPGATNRYRNSRGRVIAITPWRNAAFWRMTRHAAPADLLFDADGQRGTSIAPQPADCPMTQFP
jgi:4-hydroxyacetophenone monooxygenase